MKKLIAALVLGAMLAMPFSVMAMDAITSSELDGVSGQAGVTIAFGGTTTTRIQFSTIAWGDPDGLKASACSNSAGWLIIDGDGNTSIIIDQIIGDGQMLTLDVGSTAGSTCTPAGTAVTIPANTSFIAIGLPTVITSISVPGTLDIGLGKSAQTITGTLGLLNLRNLKITTTVPKSLYIWAH